MVGLGPGVSGPRHANKPSRQHELRVLPILIATSRRQRKSTTDTPFHHHAFPTWSAWYLVRDQPPLRPITNNTHFIIQRSIQQVKENSRRSRSRPVPMVVQPVQRNRAPNLEGPKYKISSLLGLLIFWSVSLAPTSCLLHYESWLFRRLFSAAATMCGLLDWHDHAT